MRVIVIWVFFLLKPGVGHEEFSGIKLFGFVLILIGVLFFNKIFVFDGFSIKYAGGEEEKPDKHLQKNSSDEELTQEERDSNQIGLPKLQLDDDDNMVESTTSSRENTGATLRQTTLNASNEDTISGDQVEKITDI